MRHAEEPVTLIIGASGQGIGPAVAERLAHDGHRLFLVGRSATALEALAERVKDVAPSVWLHPGDATKPRIIRHVVDDVLLHYGRLDNLVYTPSASSFGPFLEESPKDLEEHLKVSVEAPWLWMQTAIPQMLASNGGRLIFMNATAGKRGFADMAAFSAAKHALHGLVEAVAREHRRAGIQPVSLILDGMLDHAGMRERFPDKEDWSDTISMEAVAGAVSYLCRQDVRGMSHELWLTPSNERW
ncbi:MAG: SDR family oxidoreductase [Euryarchaeota archaeon]|nr:SDR family oxidoreductase [Euryarchaeota archaeon]